MRIPKRPDPQMGVFETMLVVDSRPVELDAHLSRLTASVKALYGTVAATGLRGEVVERASGLRLGRLRASAAPTPDGRLAIQVAATEVEAEDVFSGPEHPVALRTLPLDGGLGAHKWADRRLIDEFESRLPDGSVPLLVDRGGAVLEASRANVFAVSGKTLATPPADGRILRGISRDRVSEVASTVGLQSREARLTIEDLIAADEVFLTSSVRGIEPVQAIDRVELAGDGKASERLGEELRHTWIGARADAPPLQSPAPSSG
jgi:para-aminobenzoate synthetase/4-amino-4-deoxychorismate lyase